jgi:hypothetical protein
VQDTLQPSLRDLHLLAYTTSGICLTSLLNLPQTCGDRCLGTDQRCWLGWRCTTHQLQQNTHAVTRRLTHGTLFEVFCSKATLYSGCRLKFHQTTTHMLRTHCSWNLPLSLCHTVIAINGRCWKPKRAMWTLKFALIACVLFHIHSWFSSSLYVLIRYLIWLTPCVYTIYCIRRLVSCVSNLDSKRNFPSETQYIYIYNFFWSCKMPHFDYRRPFTYAVSTHANFKRVKELKRNIC